jgi:hypothetical protein
MHNELQFLIKTKSSIFDWKVYTTNSEREPSVARLGLIETDSILIKEKLKRLSKRLTGCLKEVREPKCSRLE